VTRIACVVEGHSEVESVPILIRRLASMCDPPVHVDIQKPIRISSSKLRKPHEMQRAVELAAARAGENGSVLVLFDADDDCPGQLAPVLLEAMGERADVTIGLVLAKHEYEAWFLASAESLRGKRNLRDDLVGPDDPEAIRGAKEWLGRQMTRGATYSTTLDQPALTAHFDLEIARCSNSFDKCAREITRLIGCT
jgi:Domain of unknown function (DUF4276)